MQLLTPLEEELIRKLLSQFLLGKAVSAIVSNTKVLEREYTGVGFYITLDSLIPTTLRRRIIDGVSFFADEMPNGACAVLYLKDDRLECLELCSYDGPYPETLTNPRLKLDDHSENAAS